MSTFKRQKTVLLAAIVLGLALLLARGNAGAQAPAPVNEIRFSFWGDFNDLDLWKKICARFEEKNPGLRIRQEYITGDYAQKLQLQLISNTAADLILMDDENYPGYAVRNYLEDLRPRFEQDKAELRGDDFLPTSLDSFTYDGFFGGMPWGGFPVLVFYNKDLFDAAGVPYPSPDWTWDDFRAVARALTKDTNKDGVNDQFGAAVSSSFLDLEPLVWSYGGDIINAERTKSIINRNAWLDVFKLLQTMKFEDRVTPWEAQQEGMDRQVQLLTGRLGMVMSGWYFALTLSKVEGGMHWGVADMPWGPDRKHRYSRVSWDGISINNASSPEKKDAAWRFIKFLLSEETQALVGGEGRSVPVRRADAEKHFVAVDPEVRGLALRAIEYGKLTPVTPYYEQMKQAIQKTSKKLELEDASRRMDPETALNTIEKDLDAVLTKELPRWSGEKVKTPAPWYLNALIAILLLSVFGTVVFFFGRASSTQESEWENVKYMFRSKMGRIEALFGILFASPWMIGVSLFLAFPIYFSIVLSFSEWDPYDPVGERSFVGFANFVEAFNDPLVYKALWNTGVYAITAVPLGLAISLGLALLLNRPIRGIGIVRTIFYLPTVVSGVATAVLWMYLFNPVFGPINTALHKINMLLNWALDWAPYLAWINLPEPHWLSDPNWAKPAMILMMLWGSGGASMLIFLAGLQSVPEQLYEAADLDGAGRWRKFWNVTLPMITPMLYFNLIMGMIGALQIFMQAFVMVGKEGGVDNSLLFYVLYLYKQAFIEYRMGYASALAWILFVIILTLTMFVVRSSALWVYYEGEKR